MVFKEKKTIRTNVVLDSKIIEQVLDFKHIECDTSLDNKLHKFQYNCAFLNKILQNKTLKKPNLNSTRLWRNQPSYKDQRLEPLIPERFKILCKNRKWKHKNGLFN